jgi:S1-C subfamily serine protease
MKLSAMVLAAALVPAAAFAGPSNNSNQNQNQNQTQNDQNQNQGYNGNQGTSSNQESVEVEAFQWSTGQGRLGLMLMGLTPQLRTYFGAPNNAGLLVAQVAPNSPAARAGVKVGDVITQVDNNNVQGADDISQATQSSTNSNVQIKILRNHKAMNLQASLGNKTNQQGMNDQAPRSNPGT